MLATPTDRPAALRLRAYALRVTHTELAEQTGYPRSRISRVLNGKETSAPMLDKVEAALTAAESGASTTGAE